MNHHQEAITALSGDERYYSSIGRFISAFSYLEFMIKCRIATAVGVPDDYFLEIISHDFSMLCTLAQKLLIREMDKETAARLKTVIGKCRKLNDHRVRIVHGFWLIGRRSGNLLHYHAKTPIWVVITELQTKWHGSRTTQKILPTNCRRYN
jgi:hypothetical protein